ncbi:cyclopropane-fatty-acyl-phospholipid synthase [Enterococcus dongliensis]|uniref:cyclopropane-fatty-acyl-phospholipid synthase family protein n=1 Tax=Enterococcus dongliensis TaxID=2559925 RepID=UPI00288F40DA|nr:cyclopropane-fatty-acyl-phospholipid synthase family protein [Enterococcus dongliensis]MDT2638886.1 cyclopropane-fatty-acyl-phospholipid synthase [Enterococcus dongliensis]MDT2701972.1 cyclopropane-fatty-acyl-phospholipid synthase [Enterococcus dongliensis]
MLDKEVYNQLFKPSFSQKTQVTFWDGSVKEYGNTEGEVIFEIIFNEKIPVKELISNASLALGEAYMDKKIEIKGNVQALIYDVYNQANGFFHNNNFKKWMPKEKHTKKQSAHDIHSHYDLGNDFYEMWLDRTLTYSCAYFKTPEDTLEQAQINKVHHILDKLFIQPNETLLDIGCGWGTLILTAAKEYLVKAKGITLSEEQYQHIQEVIAKEHLEEIVSVELMDYRDLKGTFDHITSVGMFEHVGSENLQEYFNVVSQHLAPNGTALIHGISRQQGGAKNAWINQYIFPGGYIPGVTELVGHITENDLQLLDLESLRRDYQYTLEHWTKNFHQVADKVIEQKDEAFYRMWDLYLQACAASFQASNIDVIQYLLVHPNNNTIPMHRNV